MRLINTKTLLLQEFIADLAPPYAILSHRWEDEEVSLQDMSGDRPPVHKAGYSKIKKACKQAQKDELQYMWIDSCCIDKSSSADLSESINSMFNLYKKARVCYAYLFDVKGANLSMLTQSVWFRRGWTLQELIAPRLVVFYNRHWQSIGTKESLVHHIHETTKIDVAILRGADLNSVSIAKRMCWASKRKTTRIEDEAYSLLGIFGVNMPMLYGEGEHAFIRLQEEIMRNSDDHSLFAWSSSDDCVRGLLAKSPASFAECHKVVRSETRLNPLPYSITNMGLSVSFSFTPWAMNTYLAALDCQLEGMENSRLGIFLCLPNQQRQTSRVMVEGRDRRMISEKEVSKYFREQVYIKQSVWGGSQPSNLLYGFCIENLPSDLDRKDLHTVIEYLDEPSWKRWRGQESTLFIPTGSKGIAGVFWFHSTGKHKILEERVNAKDLSWFKIGFDKYFKPKYKIGGKLWEGPGGESLQEEEIRQHSLLHELKSMQTQSKQAIWDLQQQKHQQAEQELMKAQREYKERAELLEQMVGHRRHTVKYSMDHQWIDDEDESFSSTSDETGGKYTSSGLQRQEGRYLISIMQKENQGKKMWNVSFDLIDPSLGIFFCSRECKKWHCGIGYKVLETDPARYMCVICFSHLNQHEREIIKVEKVH